MGRAAVTSQTRSGRRGRRPQWRPGRGRRRDGGAAGLGLRLGLTAAAAEAGSSRPGTWCRAARRRRRGAAAAAGAVSPRVTGPGRRGPGCHRPVTNP